MNISIFISIINILICIYKYIYLLKYNYKYTNTYLLIHLYKYVFYKVIFIYIYLYIWIDLPQQFSRSCFCCCSFLIQKYRSKNMIFWRCCLNCGQNQFFRDILLASSFYYTTVFSFLLSRVHSFPVFLSGCISASRADTYSIYVQSSAVNNFTLWFI